MNHIEKMNKCDSCFCKWDYILILLCFFSCLVGSTLLPVSQCPDEGGRTLISSWMVQHHTLPTGNEMETLVPGWGFSYALRPFLASIVGALFQSFFSLFTSEPAFLLAGSRMCSVLSVTLCCVFCLSLGHRCFSGRYSSFLFAAFVCFLPQVQFLGMYQNNDSLSLCAVSAMLYYLAEGFDNHWQVKTCVKLAVVLSLGALSYYIAYSWFLMGGLFCILSVLRDREISGKACFILHRGGLVVGICLVLAGWFFVRNAMLHEGDFLGMTAELRSRAYLMCEGYEGVFFNYNSAKKAGHTISSLLTSGNFYFIKRSIMSFFGLFGYMSIPMSRWLYFSYYLLTVTGVINFCLHLFPKRLSCRNCFLVAIGAMASIMTTALHIWHSYARDFQPQGRYIITVVLFLGFLIGLGIDKLGQKDNSLKKASPLFIGLLWIVLFGCAAITTMSQMLL